jgi:hypothetical protein
VNERKMKTKMRRRKKKGFNKNEACLEIKYSAPPFFLKEFWSVEYKAPRLKFWDKEKKLYKIRGERKHRCSLVFVQLRYNVSINFMIFSTHWKREIKKENGEW